MESPNKTAPEDTQFYIWRQRALYIGPAFQPRARRYDASYLAFGFQGPLWLQSELGAPAVECRVALVPPACEVYFGAEGGAYGMLFLDYLCQDLRQMISRARNTMGPFHYDFGEELEQKLLASLHRNKSGIVAANELIDMLEFKRYDQVQESDLADTRLCTLIDLYLSGHLSLNCRVSEAAAAVNLSVPRIVQLFREHLGISFKTFRSRQRMHCFLLAQAFGRSRSEAALEAGFVDQPHFCKHFKKSTGITSSQYFAREGQQTYYFVEDELARMYLSNKPALGSVVAPRFDSTGS
jgi:AraC-like DNA-binding protein